LQCCCFSLLCMHWVHTGSYNLSMSIAEICDTLFFWELNYLPGDMLSTTCWRNFLEIQEDLRVYVHHWNGNLSIYLSFSSTKQVSLIRILGRFLVDQKLCRALSFT
jgi:hypothetical protein